MDREKITTHTPPPEDTFDRTIETEDIKQYKETITYQDKKYELLFLSQKATSFPESLKESLVAFLHSTKPSEHLLRGDCAMVAGGVVRSLEASFLRQGYYIGTIGTENTTPIQFYKNKGFGHHIINYIEGENIAAAVDITASYNLEYTKHTSDIFIVVAETAADLERILKHITHTSWEVRQ